jgi:hypothetical protein
MKKIENDVNLKQQERVATILDHHPHTSMPQHGNIRKAKPHLLAAISKPGKKHDAR